MYASKCLQMYLFIGKNDDIEMKQQLVETFPAGMMLYLLIYVIVNCPIPLFIIPMQTKYLWWLGGWAQHVCPSICYCPSICRHNFVQWHACFKKMDFPDIHIDQTIFGHFLLNKSFWNTVLDWSLNLIYILNCKSSSFWKIWKFKIVC